MPRACEIIYSLAGLFRHTANSYIVLDSMLHGVSHPVRMDLLLRGVSGMSLNHLNLHVHAPLLMHIALYMYLHLYSCTLLSA